MDYYAFAFRSRLSLREMLARLERLGYGLWHERFKDAWGEYLFGRLSPAPYNAVAKLLHEEGKRFTLNVKLRPETPGGQRHYADVRRRLIREVLPAVGARWVRKTNYVG